VTRPKVFPAALFVLPDLHVCIAKGHALNFIAVRHIYHRLLLAVRSFALGYAAWVVELYALTFVRCHYFLAFFFFSFLKSAPVILFVGAACLAIFFWPLLSFFMLIS